MSKIIYKHPKAVVVLPDAKIFEDPDLYERLTKKLESLVSKCKYIVRNAELKTAQIINGLSLFVQEGESYVEDFRIAVRTIFKKFLIDEIGKLSSDDKEFSDAMPRILKLDVDVVARNFREDRDRLRQLYFVNIVLVFELLAEIEGIGKVMVFPTYGLLRAYESEILDLGRGQALEVVKVVLSELQK